MAQLTLFTHAKRENSTQVPSNGTTMDVQLKAGTTLLSPSFFLEYSGTPNWSMAAFEGRYYFVTDITSVRNNLWEIACNVDVLATYKANILNTSAFVLYDTTANAGIVDGRLAPLSTPSIQTSSAALASAVSKTGSVIVSTTGTDSVGTYIIPFGNISKLFPDIDTIFNEFITGTDVFDAIVGTMKQLVGTGSVGNNIRSCFWVPFVLEGDRVELIKIGMYDTGLGGNKIDSRIKTFVSSVPIPWQFSDWRNMPPYTEIYVYIPFIGLVHYPAAELIGSPAIQFVTSLNQQNGEIAIKVTAGAKHVIGYYTTGTAVEIPIGSSNTGILNAGAGIVAAVASAASGNIAGVGAAALAGLSPNNISVGGSSGGAAVGLGTDVICMTVCRNTSDNPADMTIAQGTPAMAVKTIGSLTGYVQTQNFSVSGSMTEMERQSINKAMDGGVYIE